jgi:drug/metabolite transporter (DMT)-like permease
VIGDLGPRRLTGAALGFWKGLPANLRGALWVTLSCLCIASMAALVKSLGARLDSFQLAFFRAGFGLLSVLPFAIGAGWGVLRTRQLKLHIVRGVAGTVAMMCGFYALTHLSLADATAITFTTPLFLTVLAALVLHETVRWRRWSATAIGFLGVLVMLRPGHGVLELAALVALLGATCVATVRLVIKRLAAADSSLTIIVWFGLVSTAVSAVPAALVWRTPTLFDLGLLVLLGCLASLTQVFMIRGYRAGEASALAPFEYARLPFAMMYGFLLFAELPDLYTLLGASIIVASTLYIARREHVLNRQGRSPAA